MSFSKFISNLKELHNKCNNNKYNDSFIDGSVDTMIRKEVPQILDEIQYTIQNSIDVDNYININDTINKIAMHHMIDVYIEEFESHIFNKLVLLFNTLSLNKDEMCDLVLGESITISKDNILNNTLRK